MTRQYKTHNVKLSLHNRRNNNERFHSNGFINPYFIIHNEHYDSFGAAYLLGLGRDSTIGETTMTNITTFKKMAVRALKRSIQKNGKAKTKLLALRWNPENPKFLAAWEEAKREVLRL